MTAEQICAEVSRRLGEPLPPHSKTIRAVMDACDRILEAPSSPGDWWAEQIILKAVELLKEKA